GHDAFASKVLALDPFGSREAVQRFVESLCAKPRVLRVKGTVAVAGKPVGVEVQAVGPRIATRFVPEAPARSALVVIGTAPLDLSDLELSSSAA
ncbi:MAG: GTP-binding protein, partial [Devosiaceae bacterium]|nr:GTP-binding protein [Devosiaceae bacterium MH13]